MAARIRLTRMGRKKSPHYRIVVADGASPRDGRIVENLGYYKPVAQPARLVVDLERADFWIGKGALPTPTVASLLTKARRGGDAAIALGEPDLDARRKAQAEALAAARAAEARKAEEAAAAAAAAKQAEAEAAAAAEAAAKQAEAEAAAQAAAEAESAAEATAEAESPAEAAPASEEPAAESPAEAAGEEEASKE